VEVSLRALGVLILAIQDPARLNWKPLSKIEQYQVGASDLLKAKL